MTLPESGTNRQPLVRVRRPDFHRSRNDSAARQYGLSLLRHLPGVARAASPVLGVLAFEDAARSEAHTAFAQAYLVGKGQALGGSGAQLSSNDDAWIDGALAEHRSVIETRLVPDLLTFVYRSEFLGATVDQRSELLKRQFKARVVGLYGGALWRISEAGFVSGARQLNDALRVEDVDLVARAIGWPTTDLQNALSRATYGIVDVGIPFVDGKKISAYATALHHVTGQVGVEYVSESDSITCPPCGTAAGLYWLPREPPLPGSVCQGGSYCRCFLMMAIG